MSSQPIDDFVEEWHPAEREFYRRRGDIDATIDASSLSTLEKKVVRASVHKLLNDLHEALRHSLILNPDRCVFCGANLKDAKTVSAMFQVVDAGDGARKQGKVVRSCGACR